MLTEEQKNGVRRLRRLLREMFKLAEYASMTGALAEGAVELAGRYNAILQRLTALEIPTDGMFPPLPEDASIDRIGIACKLLSGYLDEEDNSNEDAQGSHSGPRVIIGNMHGMEELEKLKDIGRVIRENIAEAFGNAKPSAGASSPPHSEEDTQQRPSPQPMPMPEVFRQNV